MPALETEPELISLTECARRTSFSRSSLRDKAQRRVLGPKEGVIKLFGEWRVRWRVFVQEVIESGRF